MKLRDHTRVELHRQLDDLLDLPAKNEEVAKQLGGTVLDEIVMDVLQGYGVTASVQTKHPQEEGRAVEDPSVTVGTPKPLIEVVE